jgi:hypothetical protein
MCLVIDEVVQVSGNVPTRPMHEILERCSLCLPDPTKSPELCPVIRKGQHGEGASVGRFRAVNTEKPRRVGSRSTRRTADGKCVDMARCVREKYALQLARQEGKRALRGRQVCKARKPAQRTTRERVRAIKGA